MLAPFLIPFGWLGVFGRSVELPSSLEGGVKLFDENPCASPEEDEEDEEELVRLFPPEELPEEELLEEEPDDELDETQT